MNIVYLSNPFFLDADLSYVKELRRKVDNVYFIINMPPYALKTTAIYIDKPYNNTGIFEASIYPELVKYRDYIDLDKTFIINRISSKKYAFSNIKLDIQLFNLLCSLNPDIIHTTYFFDYSDLLLYRFRDKILLTVHDPFIHSGESSLRKRMFRNIGFRVLKNFLILNKNQKDEFIKICGLDKKSVFVSSLGVYEYFNSFVSALKESSHNNMILFFGRISPYKGIEYLLEAMELVHKEYPDVKLKIVGGGKYYFDVSPYQNKEYIVIENKFALPSELAADINNCMFTVCPYTDATQSGVVMSSFALSKPTIVTNVGGLGAMVEHGKTGLVVSPRDVIALANAMKELIQNKTELLEMQEHIHAEYYLGGKSWSSIIENCINVYHKIMKI